MRVLVNELTAIRQKSGIGHYIVELMGELRAQAASDTVEGYPGPLVRSGLAGWKSVRALLPRSGSSSGGAESRWKGSLHTLARRLASLHFRAAGARGFDLYHEPNFIPLPCDRPTIVTVHDLSVLLHPEWHPADRVVYFEKNFIDGLRRCDHVLTISEFSRQEIIRHFHVPADRVTVTTMGVRAGLRPMTETEQTPCRRRLHLPERFLLHVGTMEPRKNLLMLMQAYVGLPRSLRESCPLLLAGGWGWQVGAVARYWEDVARHEGVIHMGYVADADLPALYNAAHALVFPSHYEGFGLPPLEMLACGGAVLASTAGAVVETAGRAAHLLDPQDQDGWRDAMRRIIEDDDFRRALRDGAVEASRPFTWKLCAEVTWQVYRQVAQGETNRANHAA